MRKITKVKFGQKNFALARPSNNITPRGKKSKPKNGHLSHFSDLGFFVFFLHFSFSYKEPGAGEYHEAKKKATVKTVKSHVFYLYA